MKVNPQMVAIWSQILARVPNSRIRFSIRGGADHNQSVIAAITSAGIDRSRFDLLDQLPYADYLRAYNDIDIALDPFPYNGGTTTFDALYMGVPVITLAGQLPVSRFGLTILTNLNLPDLIAHSPEQYIEIATTLATDRARLAHFRRDLRPRLLQSHLTDAKHFTQNLEATYRSMWHDWCRRHPRSRAGPASPGSPAAR
jgi:protein O-GlcNAc transferase